MTIILFTFKVMGLLIKSNRDRQKKELYVALEKLKLPNTKSRFQLEKTSTDAFTSRR